MHTGNAEEEKAAYEQEENERKNGKEEEKKRMKAESDALGESDVQWTQIFYTHQHMSDGIVAAIFSLFFLSSFHPPPPLCVCHFVSSSQAFFLFLFILLVWFAFSASSNVLW